MPKSVRIGFFLAVRQIRRASLWTTGLIIFVMVLTFLNLVVVSGILVGLIQGSIEQAREQYTSDVIISTLPDKEYIENSPNIITLVESLPEVAVATPRYRDSAVLEANYQTRREADKPDIAGAQIVGIDPVREQAVTGIGDFVFEGEFLSPTDFDKVVLGYFLLSDYLTFESPNFQSLENVRVGTKIRITVGDVRREVTVKGIIRTKTDEISTSVFMVDSQLRSIIGRNDGNVDQIALLLKPGMSPDMVRDALLLRGVGEFAKVQTFEDAQPKFLKDIVATFGALGAAFSSIGLVVAVITVFIVIFINALTRRKYIGILKGIGVSGRAIELSYVFQSFFYAVCGSIIGLAIVYGFLVPFFEANPIDFPFSDGILVAPYGETLGRIALLVISTVVAGFVPAWMIVRRNTLNSILGRN